MYRGRKCVAIVPAFNEQAKIESVLQSVPFFLDEVIVIDDGSTDNTRELIIRNKKLNNKINFVHNQNNKGVGFSIIRGYQIALQSQHDLSVILAGDGQMNPAYVSEMFDLILDNNFEVVKGNRIFFSKVLISAPKLRVVGNLLLTVINKICFEMWDIRDPQNGFVSLNLNSFSPRDFLGLDSGYLFETTFLKLIKRKRIRICDINIPASYEQHRSSLKINKIIIPLLNIYFNELVHNQAERFMKLKKRKSIIL